ncbi:unnamed protein product [Lathyrus oleraceus]
MYTTMKKSQETGVRYPVTIDSTTDKAYGEHTDDFMGYIALQGRSKVSILIDSLYDVEEELKDNLWKDVQDVFIVSPNYDNVKKKILAYYGECWRGFKTHLTHDYIKHGEDKEKPSYDVYSFFIKIFRRNL